MQVELEEEKEEEAAEEAPIAAISLAPKGPALRLRESWVAEAAGGALLRAGLSGAVLWASSEAKSLSGSIPFKFEVRARGGGTLFIVYSAAFTLLQ